MMNLFENLQTMNESEEIKTFNISFKRNDVYQANLIKGYSEEQVTDYFKSYKPDAEVLGVKLATSDDMKPGKPVINAIKESNFNKDLIIDMVKDGFETGHPYVDYDEFSQDEEIGDIDAAWEFYNKLVNMGPAGFYEEYRDEVEFSDDFIREYGNEEDLEESKVIENKKDKKSITENNDEDYGTFTDCPNCRTRFDVEEAKTDKDLVFTGDDIYDEEIYYQCPNCKKWFTEKDLGVTLESKIIKDEKDIEQIVEGIETLTEDSADPKEILQNKAIRFGKMVDALGEEMSELEINDFLKGLTTELDMDIYKEGEPYPTDLDGYFAEPVASLNLDDEADAEMFNWIDAILTDCVNKTSDFITSRIETLKGEIAAIESDITTLEGVL